MSLINKVLKDLENRERASGDRQQPAMLEDLRAAPPPDKGARGRAYGRALGAAVAAVFLVAAGVEYGRRASISHESHVGSVAAKKPVAPPTRSAPARVAVLPPNAVVPKGATSPASIARAKPPTFKARTQRAPLASVTAPRVGLPKRVSARRPHASFHGHRDGISRHAVPMTPAERSVAQYRLAIASLRQGQTGAARRELKAALGFVPGAVSPSLLLAGLDMRSGRLKAGQRVLTQGLAHHPKVRALIMLLAQVDLRLAKPAAALRALVGVPLAAQSQPYWALLAAARLRLGNVKAAVRAYEDGLQHFPHSGSLWVGLGLADSGRGHLRAAHEAFTEAQKCTLDPVLARFVQQELSGLPLRRR